MSRRRRAARPRQGGITISESDGIRYLHFGTPWVQGAMRLRRPDDLALDYARHMMAWLLFVPAPGRVLQFGLGAGTLTRWIYRQLPATAIEVVELDPAVLAVARSHFRLPPEDERLEITIADALDFVVNPPTRKRYGVLQVDVYDADARGPALDSQAFYDGCRALVDDAGVMVVNLFGEVPSYKPNVERICAAFDGRVLLLPPIEAGNVIVLAFGPFAGPWTWPALFGRAAEIEAAHGLAASGWVEGLRSSLDRGLGCAALIAEAGAPAGVA